MVMTKDVHKCAAVVRFGNVGEGDINVLRYDSDIDENNLKISTYEKEYLLKTAPRKMEYLFVGGEHNKLKSHQQYFSDQIIRPVGMFRKIPKGKWNVP